jgi:hypothetical protein
LNLENLKIKIKENRFLNKIYIELQSIFIVLQYKFLVWYYKNKKQLFELEELLAQKGFDDNWSQQFRNRKPIIFFAGNDEYQDRSGFIQELEKVCEKVHLFYKEDGSYGTYHYGSSNYKLNSQKNKQVILKILADMDVIPDILMFQAWGWNFTSYDLKEVKKRYPTIKIINICMDDRHSYWLYGNKKLGSAGLFPNIDLVLSTSSETVAWCLKENIPALFFPLGSSLDFFYPMNIEKKYDVGFVGAKYGIREEIVNAMLKSGINVKAYGNGWESGKLPLEDTNRFFNECEIILGVGTISGCKNFYNMKLRDFDALMSGGAYITHNNIDLKKLFKDSVILCNTIDEFVQKVSYYLSNKDALNKLKKESFELVKNNYTYENNFIKVFKLLGI